MKFITSVLLTALLAYAITLYGPWWSFAITSFVVGLYIHQRAWKAFLAGFLGLALLWGIYAAILDNGNGGLLSGKVADVFMLSGSTLVLIVLTAVIGGLVSAFAAVTGSFARKTGG